PPLSASLLALHDALPIWVRQGRGIAERPALGDVAKEAAHDLSAPRLRQLGRENDVVGARQSSDLLRDVRLQLVHELGRALDTALDRKSTRLNSSHGSISY